MGLILPRLAPIDIQHSIKSPAIDRSVGKPYPPLWVRFADF